MKFIDILKESVDDGPEIDLVDGDKLTREDKIQIGKIKMVYTALRRNKVKLTFNNRPSIYVKYTLPELNGITITVSRPNPNNEIDMADGTLYWFRLKPNTPVPMEVMNPEDFNYNNMIKNADNIISIYGSHVVEKIKNNFKKFNVTFV